MKEVAYVGLAFGVFGVILMITSAFLADDSLNPCSDDLNANALEECEDDRMSKARSSVFYDDIGYPLLIFSLVLMIGSNRLQDK